MNYKFFIEKPIFSAVIAILILFAGLVAMNQLPIEQYPNIMPPQIQVSTSYPGADAETVADTVAAPLEQQINGVEDMIYMYSQNSSSGDLSLSIFFNIGSNADMAQVNVQNRVSQALPQLPQEVQKIGVTVQKQTPTILMLVAMQSKDGTLDDITVSNFATIRVVDELLRLPGISDAKVINAMDYSMRVWLKPDQMARLQVSTSDVVETIQEQNKQYGIGQIGAAPMPHPVALTIPVRAKGRLTEPEEYENMIIRANLDGSTVRIKDVGWVELGSQSYNIKGKLNGKSASLIAIYQQFGANALDVAEQVRNAMDRLSQDFPKGLEYSVPYDTTLFINASIKEVYKTLIEAAILVCLVVFIFLQRLPTTLVPVVAMGVAIIGTFAGMYVLGFSINTLTLFGLVLSIGLVVDDAIVVIENIERLMREKNLNAKEAAIITMQEVSGPVISTSIVLCAVFIPVAFLGGLAGQLYKQFAITISVSVIISTLMALTLSPAVAAILIKPIKKTYKWADLFNRGLHFVTEKYLTASKWLLHHYYTGIGLWVFFCLVLVLFAKIVPTSLVPEEDQGVLFVVANNPDGSSVSRTESVDSKIYQITKDQKGVKEMASLSGYSLLEGIARTNVGTSFLTLTDWSKRESPALHASGITRLLYAKYQAIPDAQIMPLSPPPIQGIGTVGGFEFWIENRGEGSLERLQSITEEFIEKANQRPELTRLSTPIQTNNMQLFMDLDRFKTRSLGVPIGDVYQTMQVLLGSLYVNDFNKYGRVFRVTVQADPAYRENLQGFGDVYVRSKYDAMVPLKSLIELDFDKGPTLVSRFNGFNAAKVYGNAAPGYSSGQAMSAMEQVAKEVLPQGMTFSWSGSAYQEKVTQGKTGMVLIASLIIVFLILSALYENWSLPIAILLGIPFGLIGAFFSVWLRGISNDIYFQVGLVTLIALAAKNAILIVEFASEKHSEGMPVIDAALEAGRIRFRAIQMTSLTFILGVWPLVVSSGAGAASRHSVGTGVFGGMISATCLGVFFIPLLYFLIARIGEKKRLDKMKTKHEAA